MKKLAFLLLFSTAFVRIGQAAAYSTNFNSGYITSQQLAGQNGWGIDDSTPNLSFFVNYNASIAGAVGGFYDAPAAPSVRLSHSLSVPFAQSSFRADLAIVSSTLSFPGQDAFGFSVFNALGSNLITIRFEPDAFNTNLLNITWFTGAGSPVATGWAIQYDGPYHLDLAFTGAGADIQFAASVSSTNTFNFNGTLTGLAGETWDSIGADFVVGAGAAGDNFMIFDNLAAVPEPAAALLGFGVLSATLLRRRRNNC